MDGDTCYLTGRMIASEQAARDAQHPAARAVHLTLAALYKEKWLAAQPASRASPTVPRSPRAPLKPTYVPTELRWQIVRAAGVNAANLLVLLAMSILMAVAALSEFTIVINVALPRHTIAMARH